MSIKKVSFIVSVAAIFLFIYITYSKNSISNNLSAGVDINESTFKTMHKIHSSKFEEISVNEEIKISSEVNEKPEVTTENSKMINQHVAVIEQVKSHNREIDLIHELKHLLYRSKGVETIPVMQHIGIITSENYDIEIEDVVKILSEYIDSSDKDISIAADGIISDLRRLEEWKISVIDYRDNYVDVEMQSSSFLDKPNFSYIGRPESTLPLNYLQSQLMEFSNLENRLMAVKKLSLHRSDDITDLLLKASRDNNSNIRRIALKALWHAAAVGFDAGGHVYDELNYALHDESVEVSEVARKALDDLSYLNN